MLDWLLFCTRAGTRFLSLLEHRFNLAIVHADTISNLRYTVTKKRGA